MAGRIAAIFIVVISILVFGSGIAGASSVLDKLMMPGELSAAHMKLEEDCSSCHKVMQKAAQSSLCISCHKDVQRDLDKKSGFHGRDLVVANSECYLCHVEHKGRDNKLIQFEPQLFNHATTNFALEGGHKQVACASCHLPGKKYREAPHACVDCHFDGQPHKGNLGRECQNCHVVQGWKKVAVFDHDKTKFSLKGAHAKLECLSCHVGEIYKGLSMACNDCHAISDIHRRQFGLNCETCHSVEKWKGAKFDHAKNTRFALDGAHGHASCTDCHGANVMAKISMACISCHKDQDVHKASLGNNCGDCHGVIAWKQSVRFDHGLTNYPLVGLHQIAACEGCHASQVFKGASTVCKDCHAKDDTHEGRFAVACANCHSPLGWKRVAFDHGRDAHYPLTGAHAQLGCYGCHQNKNVASAKLPTDCYACHKAQDVHRGAFGTNCARCHSTQTFRSAIIRQ